MTLPPGTDELNFYIIMSGKEDRITLTFEGIMAQEFIRKHAAVRRYKSWVGLALSLSSS